MAAVLCYGIGTPAMASGSDHAIGPQTVWSDQGIAGSVTGRVTTSVNGTVGIGNAYIALVDARDVSKVYYNTTSDAYGNYQITGVNATYSSILGEGPNGQTGSDYMLGMSTYRIYAISPDGEGYSAAFGIDANQSATTVTSVVIYRPTPAGHGLQTVWSDQGKVGAVTGRVTTSVNGTVGIGNAYIALVDARDENIEYFNTTSDAYGNYQITGVNATYSSVLGEGPDGTAGTYYEGLQAYKIYAKKSPYGEGYSAAFGIDTNQSGATATSVVLFTKPAIISVKSEKLNIKANGYDHTTISAYVADALGNPVADGYLVKFHLGTDKKGMGKLAEAESGVPAGTLDVMVPTRNGYASVEFGWMTKVKKSNTITASWSDDASVSGSVTVYSANK